jgi:hypothetical protein
MLFDKTFSSTCTNRMNLKNAALTGDACRVQSRKAWIITKFDLQISGKLRKTIGSARLVTADKQSDKTLTSFRKGQLVRGARARPEPKPNRDMPCVNQKSQPAETADKHTKRIPDTTVPEP